MARRPGPLPDSAAAKLLMAAALLDLGLLYAISKAITRSIPDRFFASVFSPASGTSGVTQFIFNVSSTVLPLTVFLFLLIVFYTLAETLLGGLTPGRTVMGLHLCQKNGMPLSRKSRLSRGVRKLVSFGVSGLQINRLPSYDSAVGSTWTSTMAAPIALAPAEWKIAIRIPDGRSKSRTLGAISGFQRDQTIKIGRDPNWADIVLPNDTQASARHCIIRLIGRRLEIRDENSSNGTRLEGRRISPEKWMSLASNQHFYAADVLCKIET